MPEKMTKEEAEISRAIRLVRKAKETIKLVGSSTELPYDDEVEHVKVKRPKAENYNVNQKKEGYGMGGETIGKAVDVSIDSMFKDVIEEIAYLVKTGEDSRVEQEEKVQQVEIILNEFKRRLVTYLESGINRGKKFTKSDINIKGTIEMLNDAIKGERLTYGKYKDPKKVEKITRMINRLKKLPKLIEDGHWTKGEEAGVKAILQEETMFGSLNIY